MNINGQNLTLTDLSHGKIKENYLNEKFNNQFSQTDFTKNKFLIEPENIIYIENKNYIGNNQYIYNTGYIYSTLPSPYEIVYENGEYYIELIFPKIYQDLSSPKISSPNLYIENTLKQSINQKEKNISGKIKTKSTISKPMR